MTAQSISLDKITVDDSLQVRADIDGNTVTEYRLLMREGQLPPIDVFKIGSKYLLAGGWHRLAAARDLNRLDIECQVHEGDRRAAVLFSAGANATHGRSLNRNEKRIAVRVLLADSDWFQWSNARIGKHCGLSAPTVATIRDSFVNEEARKSGGSGGGIKNTFDSRRKRKGKGGTTVSFKPPPGRRPQAQAEKNLADLNGALETLARLPFGGRYAVELHGDRITDKADVAVEWVAELGEARRAP